MALARGTNVYFKNYKNSGEQELWRGLHEEAIKIYGHDMFYIPRVIDTYDPVYGEDDTSKYERAIPIEMYLKTFDGYEGDGLFQSKFGGLNLGDQVRFLVSKRVFDQELTQPLGILRPNESDLIHFPMIGKTFSILYTNYKEFFYQLGDNYIWEIVCELFTYTNQTFSTGIPEIDELNNHSTDIADYAIVDENGNPLVDEHGTSIVMGTYKLDVIDPNADNDAIQDEQELDELIPWSEVDPYSEGNY
jgi:hypothetical protein